MIFCCVSPQLLFVAVLGLTVVMMCLKGFGGPWYRYFFRFLLLFSYIIPIRLVHSCCHKCVIMLWVIYIYIVHRFQS